jgi:hypothetical protein
MTALQHSLPNVTPAAQTRSSGPIIPQCAEQHRRTFWQKLPLGLAAIMLSSNVE